MAEPRFVHLRVHSDYSMIDGLAKTGPLVFYRTDKTDAGQFADQCAALAERLDTLWQTEPIPFRRQNHGDYLIPSLTLRPELAPGQSGLAVHLRSE